MTRLSQYKNDMSAFDTLPSVQYSKEEVRHMLQCAVAFVENHLYEREKFKSRYVSDVWKRFGYVRLGPKPPPGQENLEGKVYCKDVVACMECFQVYTHRNKNQGTSNLRHHRCNPLTPAVPTHSPNSTVPNPVATQGPSRTTNNPSTHHSALPTITQQTPVQNHPSEVCLRWNSYHLNMQAVFPSLLSNEQFVDVTLACEGQSIKCHKIILSACSAYFEQLLSQNPCQHPIVLMKDLHFWQVQALVEFMYRGEVNVAQDKLPSLLSAAEALQIKGLAHPTTTTTTTPNTTASTTTASSTTSLRDQDSVPASSAADSATPHRAADEPQQPSLIRTRRRHSSSTPIILRQCIDVSKQASRSLLQPKCTNKLKLHSRTKAESTETMDELSNLTKLSGPYRVKMIKTESPLEEGRHSGIKVKMEPVEIKTEVEEDEDMEMENEDSYDFDTSFVDEVMGAELRVVEEDGGLEDFECTDKGQNDNAHNSDKEEQSAVMDTEDTLMPDSGKTGEPEKKRPK